MVGLIPGPKEPDVYQINSYMRPMVDELSKLWLEGFILDDKHADKLYAAVLCCACDVPAARKLCGFLGHSSKLGCHKCKKEFKTGKSLFFSFLLRTKSFNFLHFVYSTDVYMVRELKRMGFVVNDRC